MYSLISAPFFRTDISVCRLSGTRYNFRFRRAIYSLAVLLCLPIVPATAAGIHVTSGYTYTHTNVGVGGQGLQGGGYLYDMSPQNTAYAAVEDAIPNNGSGEASSLAAVASNISAGENSLIWTQNLQIDARALSVSPYCPPGGLSCNAGLSAIATADAYSSITFILDSDGFFELSLGYQGTALPPGSGFSYGQLSGLGGESILFTEPGFASRSGYLGAGTWTLNAVMSASTPAVRAQPPPNGGGTNQASAQQLSLFTVDFSVTTVPIPAAAWLFGGALGLLGVARRRSAA
jgi:hypothetical protein